MYGYKGYMFAEKDPAIAVIRAGIKLVAVAMGTSEVVVRKKLARDIRMSPATLYSWFSGPTRMPRHAGIEAVTGWLLGHISERALGYKSNVVSLAAYRDKHEARKTRRKAA